MAILKQKEKSAQTKVVQFNNLFGYEMEPTNRNHCIWQKYLRRKNLYLRPWRVKILFFKKWKKNLLPLFVTKKKKDCPIANMQFLQFPAIKQ